MPEDPRIMVCRLPGDTAVIVLPDLSAACIDAALPPRERHRIAAFLVAHLPRITDAPTSGAGHPGA